jgi:hypothetical protein
MLVGVFAAATAAACSSGPTTQARVCQARSDLQNTVGQVRNFDYGTQTASELTALLNSMRSDLKKLEAAAHLPQNSALGQLGGVGRIRQLEGQIGAIAQAVEQSGHSRQRVDLASFENEVRQRTAEAQQIAGAVAGC